MNAFTTVSRILPGVSVAAVLLAVVGAPAIDAPPRQAIPSTAAQAEAEKLVHELYKADYARRRPADQQSLATKLLAEGRSTKDNPAGRFVLFREARDLAALAGDAVLACDAVDALAADFEYDVVSAKVELLQRMAKGASTPSANRGLAELAVDLMTKAVQADVYDVATRLADVAATCAARCGNPALRKQIDQRIEAVRFAGKEFIAVHPAMDVLRDRPDDPAANLTVGRFHCLVKGDWDRGVLLLARGSDGRLKQIARLDLRRPVNPTDQVVVGDSWWDLAESERGATRTNLQRRAGHWYKLALPNLTGLTEAKIQRRLRQIADLIADEPTEVPGEVGQLAVLTGHTNALRFVAVTPDGRRIVSSGDDKTVHVWDGAAARDLITFKGHNQVVWSVAISPDGRSVASVGGDKAIRVWDLETGRETCRLDGHTSDIIGVTFLADGKRVISCGADQTIRFWDVDKRRELRRMPINSGNIHRVIVSPDRKTLASSGNDRVIRLWNLQTGRPGAVLAGHSGSVFDMAFSPDGHRLYSGGADELWRCWDLDTVKESRRGEGNEALALSPDGKRLLTGGKDCVLRLYETASGRELAKFPGHTSVISSIAFFPDGRRAVSASFDRTARIWRLP
jgi:WD40 repeat protein